MYIILMLLFKNGHFVISHVELVSILLQTAQNVIIMIIIFLLLMINPLAKKIVQIFILKILLCNILGLKQLLL